MRTERLRLQMPTMRDLKIMLAGASDPQAQRWLGWRADEVTDEDARERLLCLRAGEGTALPRAADGHWTLAAVEWATSRVAGGVGCESDGRDLGGWLAPQFRGHGLGRELFAGAAEFAHHHLGIASVHAGTEVTNAACIAALTSAGYVPADGPPSHELPDGRMVPTRWLRHDADHPSRCRGADPALS
jgi:RimJ/RimL family protein N-acetyltransferase